MWLPSSIISQHLFTSDPNICMQKKKKKTRIVHEQQVKMKHPKLILFFSFSFVHDIYAHT
jgi:hypothetical protein